MARIGRGRAAAILVAAVIGLATIAVVATHTPGNAGAAIQDSATSPNSKASSAAVTPSPTPTRSNPPTTPAGQIAVTQTIISQLVGDGQLDPDAANDLSSNLDDIGGRHGKNQNKQTADRLAELRQKLGELRQQGKLSTSGYDTLTASLDQLAASLPTGDPGRN